MSPSDLLRRSEKATGMPEKIFKALFLFVPLYVGYLFYLEEKYIMAVAVFVLMIVLIWTIIDSEIF